MKITFTVNYHTTWGQNLYVYSDIKLPEDSHFSQGIRMQYIENFLHLPFFQKYFCQRGLREKSDHKNRYHYFSGICPPNTTERSDCHNGK